MSNFFTIWDRDQRYRITNALPLELHDLIPTRVFKDQVENYFNFSLTQHCEPGKIGRLEFQLENREGIWTATVFREESLLGVFGKARRTFEYQRSDPVRNQAFALAFEELRHYYCPEKNR